MKKWFLILSTLLFFICSCKKEVKEIKVIGGNEEKEVPQYGTPFTGVPDRQDVTMYQVNVRTFSEAGNFEGVTKRLDSIKALGVNVLYIMPINPIGVLRTINSPYCIKNHSEVNPEFGDLTSLRALIDGAHERGMAVLMDWVGSYTAWDNIWIGPHKDWYLQNSAGEIVIPPNTNWNDVAKLNFNNLNMRLEQIKQMKNWLLRANFDGFRFDYTAGASPAFWKQVVDSLRKIDTRKLLLLAEGDQNENYSAGFDFNFAFGFFNNLKAIFDGTHRSAQSIDNLNISEFENSSNNQQTVRYTTNHDVNSSDGTPQEIFGGQKGSMAAFVVVAYMKGVPMVYTGQEVGTPNRMHFPFTSANINWDINPEVKAEYKKIIAFRNSSQAIRRGSLTSYSNADVCMFTKKLENETVLIIVNLRNKPTDFYFSGTFQNSAWVNALGGAQYILGIIPLYQLIIILC